MSYEGEGNKEEEYPKCGNRKGDFFLVYDFGNPVLKCRLLGGVELLANPIPFFIKGFPDFYVDTIP